MLVQEEIRCLCSLFHRFQCARRGNDLTEREFGSKHPHRVSFLGRTNPRFD
jgi:hypothetical protein